MKWKASPPAIEIAAVTIAVSCLGGAVGFAVARLAPFATGLVAGGAGTIVALAAWLILRRIDHQRDLRPSFAPESLGDLLVADGVLLLDQPVDDDELLLDDPLPVLGDASRVVRLFAAQPAGTEVAPLPLAGPGEMIARIEDFLGEARGIAARVEPIRRADQAATDDASAALHAALADIRRSLRQG